MRAFFFLAGLLIAVPAYAAIEPRPPSVTIIAADRATLVETVTVTGTLAARDEILLSPQIENLAIIEILAEEGDKVQAGQVLARLAHDALDASLAQNTAQIARAEAAIAQAESQINETDANRKQAEAAFERTKTLITKGDASRETFDTREAAARITAARVTTAQNVLLATRADLALANAQRQELAVKLGRTELRAPAAGIVSRRTARLGAVITMAAEPLFRIIAAGAIELEGDVPETQLVQLRPDQPARVFVAGGDTARPGHVRLVAPEIARATRLGRVRVAIDDSTGLAIGSFARAEIESNRQEGVRVPLSAVLFLPDGARLQVVADGRVETRAVTLGLRSGGFVLVTTGLAAGETVVSISGTFVRNGDRVSPVRVSER
jgi:HlyD family secretion protein